MKRTFLRILPLTLRLLATLIGPLVLILHGGGILDQNTTMTAILTVLIVFYISNIISNPIILNELEDKLINEIKQSEARIVQNHKLNTLLTQNPEFNEKINQLCNEYSNVYSGEAEPFIQRADDLLDKHISDLHNLAEGKITVAPRTRYFSGRELVELAEAGEKVRAVSVANPNYWNSTRGQGFLKENIHAVERGVEVIRIWCFNRETLEEHQDIFLEQKKAGIETLIVEVTPDLPMELLGSYLIIGNRLCSNSKVVEMEIEEDVVSTKQLEIREAIDRFKTLATRYAREYDDYFNNNKGVD